MEAIDANFRWFFAIMLVFGARESLGLGINTDRLTRRSCFLFDGRSDDSVFAWFFPGFSVSYSRFSRLDSRENSSVLGYNVGFWSSAKFRWFFAIMLVFGAQL
jgi:hypothetical protein